VQDSLPSTTAMVTFDVGQGGFLNFPVGTASLRLTHVKTGIVLNSVSSMVRAAFIRRVHASAIPLSTHRRSP
jgi:hypothetical protein